MWMSMKIRTYSELIDIETFVDRFKYLSLNGQVGCETFGFDRWINQRFYTSREWRSIREKVIIRDKGCDLGVKGYEIHDRLIVHHMNPLTQEDLQFGGNRKAIEPEFLICTTHNTHNAIHYGDESLLTQPYIPRTKGDTKLW